MSRLCVMLLVCLIVFACSSETVTFYEKDFLLQEGARVSLEQDARIEHRESGLYLVTPDGENPVASDVLRLRGSTIRYADGSVKSVSAVCSRRSPDGSLVAEVRLRDVDGEPGFDSIDVKGDVSTIAPELEPALQGILSFGDEMTRLVQSGTASTKEL